MIWHEKRHTESSPLKLKDTKSKDFVLLTALLLCSLHLQTPGHRSPSNLTRAHQYQTPGALTGCIPLAKCDSSIQGFIKHNMAPKYKPTTCSDAPPKKQEFSPKLAF